MIRAVLFDLDGTLLDSAPDLVGALNWLRGTEGLPPLPLNPVSRYVSRGAVGLLTAGMPETDEKQFEDWRLKFLDHYARHSCEQSSLYDGIEDLLEYLDSNAVPWGVVTNKSEALTFPIIQDLGLAGRIACTVCGDTLSRNKPDPAPVKLACSIIDVAPEFTLFAGDDVRDLQAGHGAGTQTAAVHYGYGAWELDDEIVKGSYQVHQPSDMLDLLRAQRASDER